LLSNLSQLGIVHRANKKPRPIIAGQGCVGSDTKLLCMRFAVELGPHHGTEAPYPCSATDAKNDSAASRRSRNFHDKALSVSSPDQGNLDMAKII
jgi:hypothetical protein